MRAYLSGYSSATEAGYGDVFVFEVEVTLPAVTDADKFDANLEIFSFQPTTRKKLLAPLVYNLIFGMSIQII